MHPKASAAPAGEGRIDRTSDRRENTMSEYAVVNPATGETLATYPTITDDALEGVIAGADAAFRTWRHVPVADRAAAVRKVAELHRERRDELAAIIVREMGKPLEAALGEVDFAA